MAKATAIIPGPQETRGEAYDIILRQLDKMQLVRVGLAAIESDCLGGVSTEQAVGSMYLTLEEIWESLRHAADLVNCLTPHLKNASQKEAA